MKYNFNFILKQKKAQVNKNIFILIDACFAFILTFADLLIKNILWYVFFCLWKYEKNIEIIQNVTTIAILKEKKCNEIIF